MTADEIRKVRATASITDYYGTSQHNITDGQMFAAAMLQEIAAQLAELNAALASLMTSPADGIRKQLAVWAEGRP